MAGRIASPFWLRAEGAIVPWAEIARTKPDPHEELTGLAEQLFAERLAAVRERPGEIHLRWSCSERLGVPFEPFTVWARPRRDETGGVDARIDSVDGGLRISWGFVAAIIEVECDVLDPTRAVGLFASRGGGSLLETVGAVAVRQPAGGRVRLRLRTSGATRALLVNGANPSVACRSLQDVIDDQGWQEIERVGLPVDDPWGSTAYRPGGQGLVSAPTDPVSAAFERLARGGPPIGWASFTESGRLAPVWAAPDHGILIDEVRDELLPQVESAFRPGLLPLEQAAVRDRPTVASPHHAGKTSSLAAHAELAPLSLLTLPSASNPFIALATGFGTAYSLEGQGRLPLSRADFMVTGEYEETPRRTGRVQVAAFIPAPGPHGTTAAANNLAAQRAGLVAPDAVDRPWRESVRVSWDRLPSAAALGRPSGAVVARFDPAGPLEAESLVPKRAAGDLRPLLPVPDGPEGTPAYARTAMADAAAEIPLGAGSRQAGYAVAVEDVFGVWSRWEDALHTGPEPAPPRPRVLALGLTSSYEGFTACPAALEVELSVDWADRTPVGVDVAAVFFRMPTAATPPPAGIGPDVPAPAGGFRRDFALGFAADELRDPGGTTIEHLDSAGQELVEPGPLQGANGRRYRLRVADFNLDFGATPRWGVQVWLRGRLAVLAAPTDWAPDPSHPALATAASPVPVAPLPPPLPPGVPIGSAPDAEGRSHARIRWSLPAGAPVEKVILWEVAETALREQAGIAVRAPEGTLPGLRLAELWNRYDSRTSARRRSMFRRLKELPGTARETDVALPKGSTDIHLFAVTTVSSTAVESPWPEGTPAHLHLQAVMAPRLRRPGTPRARSTVAADGSVAIALTSPSRVPVQAFRLFRSRSVVAARSAETMGPAFAMVTATPGGTDPDSGERAYEGTWTGSFDPSWDEWFVRAVAVPVDQVPTEAVRGLPSAACEPVSLVVLPAAPPDLAPLTGETWGTANDGVLVRSSTSSPDRPVGLGSHRLSGVAGTSGMAAVPLEDINEDVAIPPTGASPGPVLVRGPRSAGRTPLAVWFTRPVAADPVDVVLRLVDPLGRLTEQRITVPGWVPGPPPTLELIDRMTIAGRGTVFTLRSDAPVDADPPYVLEVAAVRRPVPFPIRGRGPIGRLQTVRTSFPLDDIPVRVRPFTPVTTIQAARTTGVTPFEYTVLVRLQPPFRVVFRMVAPDGPSVEVEAAVR